MLLTPTLPLCGIVILLGIQFRHAVAERQKLRVTSILLQPYLMHGDDGDPDNLIGFCKDIAEKISEVLDVEHEIHIVKDGRYGTMNLSNPGVWTGMIGELLNNEADLAIADLAITTARSKVVDFSTPFQEFQMSILIKKPSKTDNDRDAAYTFLLPFHTYVWLSAVFAILGIWILSLLVEYLYKRPENRPSGLFSFLRQDSICSPESCTGKLIRAMFWAFIFIILSAYAASFAAQRIVDPGKHVTPEVDSAEELLKAGDNIHYGVVRGGAIHAFFRNADNPLYKQMYEFMTSKNTFVLTNAQGIQKVLSGGPKFTDDGENRKTVEYAFIVESPTAENLLSKGFCDLRVAAKKFGPTKGYGVATVKGSPWRERVNLAILEMKEKGELEELENKWWDKGVCAEGDDVDANKYDFDQLYLSELAGVFYFLFIGVFIVIIFWLLERRSK